MMRVSYSAFGEAPTKKLTKAKSEKQRFLEEVEATLEARAIFDDEQAKKKFAKQQAELDRKKLELQSLKETLSTI